MGERRTVPGHFMIIRCLASSPRAIAYLAYKWTIGSARPSDTLRSTGQIRCLCHVVARPWVFAKACNSCRCVIKPGLLSAPVCCLAMTPAQVRYRWYLSLLSNPPYSPHHFNDGSSLSRRTPRQKAIGVYFCGRSRPAVSITASMFSHRVLVSADLVNA